MMVGVQGWRLDPLLLFGQLLTAGTATAFAVESLRLRDIISEEVGTPPSGYPSPLRHMPLHLYRYQAGRTSGLGIKSSVYGDVGYSYP